MKKGAAPISLAGSQLGNTRHVCAFFNSDDEEYRVLLPFIKDGFTCGDKAIHVVNPDQREDHLQRLAAAGIDTAAAEQAGQLSIRTNMCSLCALRRPPWPYFRRRSATDGKTLVQQRCRAQVYSEARPSLDVSATLRDELPFVKRPELRQTRYLREAFVLANARDPRKA